MLIGTQIHVNISIQVSNVLQRIWHEADSQVFSMTLM